MFISYLCALIGCLITGLQTYLILTRGTGICFNAGCTIVEQLTLVPPLYINLAGLLFFLVLSLSLAGARKGSEGWRLFAGLLLLAGLAAEGVLFSFQFFVTDTYCSYCLIILALIVLANLFMGLVQMLKGALIFGTVVAAFGALDFKTGAQPTARSLEQGSIGRIEAAASTRQLFLFFSSTCPHCERLIDTIGPEIRCSIGFNPVDRIESFSLPGLIDSPDYSPQVNLRFLQALGIAEVPVLVDRHQQATTIWKGEQTIRTFLDLNCAPDPAVEPAVQAGSTDSSSQETAAPLPGLPDESCGIETDCDPETLLDQEPNGQTPAQ